MNFAGILSGGIGNRMGKDYPKQFIELDEKPLLAYCIENFIKVDELDKIIVSSPLEWIDKTEDLIYTYFENEDRIILIEGGKTRAETILNSINYIESNYDLDEDPILVTHDAARIFVSPELIRNSIKYGKEYGACSACIPSTDVLFESKNDNLLKDIPLRKSMYRAQTPQSFKAFHYKELYENLSDEDLAKVDEAAAVFNLSDEDVYLFEGESSNFKITRPFDLEIAKTYLK